MFAAEFNQLNFDDTLAKRCPAYQLVRLANGAHTVFSSDYAEKMHPGLGPTAEAELLYVRQLKIPERMRAGEGEFVVWDVGLGAAANATGVLRATRNIERLLRLVSFDNTSGPLEFALANAEQLGYFQGYESQARTLIESRVVTFQNGRSPVTWEFHLGDFPTWLANVAAGVAPAVEPGIVPGGKAIADSASAEVNSRCPGGTMPPSTSGRTPDATPVPHAIMFDAFSPAQNPAMWTLPLFTNLFRALDPARSCNLTTYSRSTMLRVTLLLAGFFVGRGVPTGLKEETTVVANRLELIDEPLDCRWLERARRSDSAEPLHKPEYQRARLTSEGWKQLRTHPQFNV